MASQGRGPDDAQSAPAPPVAAAGADSPAPYAPTHMMFNSAANADVPDDPLGLTVDFEPSRPVQPLTVTDVTEIGIGSKPSLPLAPHAAAAAVRHAVPGYEVLRELGRGGMGVVYQARQKGLNRLVALKMILAGDHAGGGERDRFRREAESVAALQHPNIVQIFEIGEADGRPYLAFEYIEGGTLAHHLAGNPWPSRAAAALVETLARAVQFAHERGIVHRDLKPGNILMSVARRPTSGARAAADGAADVPVPAMQGKGDATRNDESGQRPLDGASIPKITDFGLAKRVVADSAWSTGEHVLGKPGEQTRTGAVMGTPSYIAPEQAAGKNRDVGPSVDVYALGAILYELLTGRPPFRGETPLDTVLQVMADDPISPRRLQPKVPRDLETICLRCLQKTPGKRYASAGDLADDLRRFLNHLPIDARPIGSHERLIKWAKRHPALATSLSVSILALVTMLGISFSFNVALRKSAAAIETEASNARRAALAANQSAKEKEEQTRLANEQTRLANEQAQKAEDARKDAERDRHQARRTTYALALNRALALVERDPFRAALLLDKREECPFEFRDFTWHYLRAMCRVDDPRVLDGHAKAITQIVWSPNGTRLATSSWDGSIRVWDAKTHRAVAVLRGHRDDVRAVAFTPEGTTLVSAGRDHHVNFWELPAALPEENGGEPMVLAPWASLDVGDVWTVATSPDGAHAAAGSADGKIHLFTLPVRAAMIATGGAAGALALRVPTHADVLTGHKGRITSLVWASDGLYSGGFDHAVLRWTPGENLEGTLVYQNNDNVLDIDVLPNGELLAVAGSSSDKNSIKLVNLRQGKEVARMRGHIKAVNSVAFSRDGKHLASASEDHTVRLWDTSSGQEVGVFRGHVNEVRSVAFSPDQQTVASAGLGHVVRFWNLAAPHEQTAEITFNAPLPPVPQPAAAVANDSSRLAVVDRDNSIKIWVRSAQGFARAPSYALRGLSSKVDAFSLSADGSIAAAAAKHGNESVIAVWELPLPKDKAAKFPPPVKAPRLIKANGEVQALALHGSHLAVIDKNGLEIWDLQQNRRRTLAAVNDVHGIAFTPDGSKLLSTGDRTLQVWDTTSGREACRMMLGHVKENILSILVGPPLEEFNPERAPHPGSSWTVITTDRTGAAWVWSLFPAKPDKDGKLPGGQTMELERLAILTGHAEPITSVAFTKNGKTIATTSEDRTIRLWDPVIGRERAALTSHTDPVLLATFLDDDSALLSLGHDGTLKTWHAPK